MKQQLIKLLALQKHDIQLQELQREKSQIPSELETMKNDVQNLELILQKEIGNLAELESWKTEQETGLQEEEERIQKRLNYMDNVQTGKEYFEMQKELDSHRKKARDHETEILKLMEVVEERKTLVEERKTQIERFWNVYNERENEGTERLKEIDEKVEKLTSERKILIEGVEKKLLRQYEFLASRKFPALANAENEICLGCHMGIPPQKFNSLYNVSEIIECPFCGRILYIEEALQE
ncbi:MAG: hypothetical protein JXR95_07715 [Deltaproteobacteria bacterium]|nr:hypothetical protein [Deltaproteobacteria bacterium]